jgi:L-2-hydroxyglutarate oxidase LhgO
VAVVGAGIVGLASAAKLAAQGRSLVVLERNAGIAQETTSRNSQVVHAGIYYPQDSLKATLCVAGRHALVQRCRERGIGYRRIGKCIVATDASETAELEALLRRGMANGVEELEWIDAAEMRRLEPDVAAVAALRSPASGIVDAHELALSYQAEAEEGGAVVLVGHEVVGLSRDSGAWRLEARASDGEVESVRCAAVVNAAGLAADRVAELAGVDVDAAGLRLHPCKGDYFALAPGAPLQVRRLVYPVPAGPGLGVHATLDLGGRIRFGPDASYVAAPHYDVDAGKAKGFAEAISRYLPGMRAEWLTPDQAGVRPKLSGPGEPFRDFVVREESALGLPGLVDCVGIESPGLTAAPAIAERVAELLASL